MPNPEDRDGNTDILQVVDDVRSDADDFCLGYNIMMYF